MSISATRQAHESVRTQCAIAGGGPAGLMLGVLLARAGVNVTVLEKHADFLRDFRGDTIHPSTLEVMHELGWLDELLRLPHDPVKTLSAMFGDTAIKVADFSRLPTHAKFIAMMPQWDFLNFLAEKGGAYPNFRLMMSTTADDLIVDGDTVTGVTAHGADGSVTIAADLVVAADGRTSTLRAKSGLKSETFGAPMDVMWFRLPRHADDTTETQGRFRPGGIAIMLNRATYWQCAYVIAKGGDSEVRARGLQAFRDELASGLPFDRSRADALTSWDQVKLLTVAIDRLTRWWRPGLLCIGDAAHAMSPVGGVGVNIAIQDAVATANILARRLKENRVTPDDLARVEARRAWPTRVTQRMQLQAQDKMIGPTLAGDAEMKPPLPLRLVNRFPILSHLTARMIGLGVRPEHVSRELR